MLKICGITTRSERDALFNLPVDFYGLWHRTNGGSRQLSALDLGILAQPPFPRGNTGPKPCLVTLENDPEAIADIMVEAQITTVQLHGFILPPGIWKLREAAAKRGLDIQILKVLHLEKGRCLEKSLVRPYIEMGTDIFILDNFGGRGAIGSTGLEIDVPLATEIAKTLSPVPVLLAGGVRPAMLRKVQPHVFAGFDVDTAARLAGKIHPSKVSELSAAISRQSRAKLELVDA